MNDKAGGISYCFLNQMGHPHNAMQGRSSTRLKGMQGAESATPDSTGKQILSPSRVSSLDLPTLISSKQGRS